jgi:hypothetical protein
MTNLILNCALYVILSSALPLLVKVLGITNFDLLGNFGRIRWLGNYFIIFGVNIVFGGAAAVCLFNKVTHRAQAEIWRRLTHFLGSVRQQVGGPCTRHRPVQVMEKLGPLAKSLGLRMPPSVVPLAGTPMRCLGSERLNLILFAGQAQAPIPRQFVLRQSDLLPGIPASLVRECRPLG